MDRTAELSVARAQRRTVGDPLDFNIERGPQIDFTQFGTALRAEAGW